MDKERLKTTTASCGSASVHSSSEDPRRSSSYYATSAAIERLILRLNQASPINLEFFTFPVAKACIRRVHSLETYYARFRLFRFLIRKGVHPILLFASVSAGWMACARRFYMHSRPLTLTLFGVVYPVWRCWSLIRRQEGHVSPDTLGEYKMWLTYWILYGSLEVLDQWRNDLLYLVPNYYLYKLVLLYWAQNPHSNGAALVYKHIIQKPQRYHHQQNQPNDDLSHSTPLSLFDYSHNDYPVDIDTEQRTRQEDHSVSSSLSSVDTSPLPISDEVDHDANGLTLTIERVPANTSPPPPVSVSTSTINSNRRSMSILDGYTPTLERDTKELYPVLNMETEAAAW